MIVEYGFCEVWLWDGYVIYCMEFVVINWLIYDGWYGEVKF